jgi:site-specific recombinase XerD
MLSEKRGELDSEVSGIMDAYTDYLVGRQLSEATVRCMRKQARRFLRHLERRGRPISELERGDIAEYWVSAGERLAHSTMAAIRGSLSSLLPFLAARGITEEDLSVALPSVTGRVTRIKRLYTDEEIASVLDSIDRESLIGKRRDIEGGVSQPQVLRSSASNSE